MKSRAAWAALAWALAAANIVFGADVCELRVTTDPAQAAIIVDGVTRGISPTGIVVSAERHLVVARKDGYEEARKSVVGRKDSNLLVELRLEPVTGLVLIHSQPSGASLEIDGSQRGKTPQLVTDIGLGSHRVKAMLPGHLPAEREFRVDNRFPMKIELILRSESASMSFTSDPAGADVTVNGILRGRTPCVVGGLSPGAADISVALKGYRPFGRVVKLQSSEDAEINAVLEPLPGALEVFSIPAGAIVYVDNQRRGNTPLVLEGMEPGEYRIRVELEGSAPLARNVKVELGGRAIEEFRLERSSGSLEVVTKPSGVSVTVDGENCGMTVTDQDRPDGFSATLKVERVAAGTRRVELVKKGHERISVNVNVGKDATVPLSYELKRVFIPDTLVRLGKRAEDAFLGVEVLRFENGDIKLELKPGVFRLFRHTEIRSIEPYSPKE